jgi:hypothetical protein
MFQVEIDQLTSKLFRQIHTGSEYVLLQEILNSDLIEDGTKNYFRAEIEWWIYKEREYKTTVLDLLDSTASINQLFNTLDEVFRERARFSIHDLRSLLHQFVSARLNFLCRPRETLKQFVFRNKQSCSLEEILLRINYFSEYAYLNDGIRSWFFQLDHTRKDNVFLTKEQFQSLVASIDDSVLLADDFSPQTFVELLTPLFEFFDVASSYIPPRSVPIETLILFLDDKEIVPIAKLLTELYHTQKIKFVTKSKLLSIINGFTEVASNTASIDEEVVNQQLLFDTTSIKEQSNFLGKSISTSEQTPKITPTFVVDKIEAVHIPEKTVSQKDTIDSILENVQSNMDFIYNEELFSNGDLTSGLSSITSDPLRFDDIEFPSNNDDTIAVEEEYDPFKNFDTFFSSEDINKSESLLLEATDSETEIDISSTIEEVEERSIVDEEMSDIDIMKVEIPNSDVESFDVSNDTDEFETILNESNEENKSTIVESIDLEDDFTTLENSSDSEENIEQFIIKDSVDTLNQQFFSEELYNQINQEVFGSNAEATRDFAETMSQITTYDVALTMVIQTFLDNGLSPENLLLQQTEQYLSTYYERKS